MDYSTELLTAELSFSADADIENKLAGIDKQIEKYTNHADRFDYALAVASGLLCGVLDSYWVGELSIESAHNGGSTKVDSFVLKIARSQGYKGNDVKGAIRYLAEEKKHKNPNIKSGFHLASDSNMAIFGGTKYHHLRDFSHHPTPVGLFFSILTQFTHEVYGTNTAGEFIHPRVANEEFIGESIGEKILFGFIYWFFHMVSDMAGSGGESEGTGIPGPFISLAKELSALPLFKELDESSKRVNLEGSKKFSVWVQKMFSGTMLGEKDETGKMQLLRVDLRTEVGVAGNIGKQAIVVLLNECIVRAAYFIRRLLNEIKEKSITSINQLNLVSKTAVVPKDNRTITRMLTISTATFSVADMTDAAVRAAIESAGNYIAFSIKFVSRVNYVGVGRAALAIKHEYDMESEEARLWHEKRLLVEQKSAQIVAQIDAYKEQLEALVSQYIAEDIELYLTSFNEMDKALETGDSDAFIHANVTIQSRFGREAQFETQEEFDELMDSDEAFVL